MTASALCSVAVVLATFAQDSKILNVRFADGTFARVQVLELAGERVKLRELILDGSMEVRHVLADFTPRSAFRIEVEGRRPESFDDHFALAKRAAALGLPAEAGQQAQVAIERLRGLPDEADRTKSVRTWAAGTLESWLRSAVEERRLGDAIRHLERLSSGFPDLRSEAELDALAAAVETLEQDRAARRRVERQSRVDAQVRGRIERRLKPIRQLVSRGDKLYRQAIAASSRMTKSNSLATRSIEAYRDAWKAAADLQKRFPEDAALVLEIESLANHLHDHAIRAALHAANMLTIRGDFGGAHEWVAKVLALDPTHAEAKEMQHTITVAGAAASAPWGWGLGGGVAPRR